MLQLLTLHYERCGRYYGSVGGQGSYGSASDEEKRLTMMLFSNIFDSLSQMVRHSSPPTKISLILMLIQLKLVCSTVTVTTSNHSLYWSNDLFSISDVPHRHFFYVDYLLAIFNLLDG